MGAQAMLITHQFKEEIANMRSNYRIEVKIGDVCDFQGAQADIIIVSCVAGGNSDHEMAPALSDPASINLMLTRCKCALWIFGNCKSLSQASTIWKELIQNAEER